APTPTTPANGATNVATSTSLSWSATGATSYDIAFGTTNPPASVATGLTAATYTPTSLANATTYFWQVTAKNAGGSTIGPMSSFTTVPAPTGLPTPWNGGDIGSTGLAGSSTYANGVFTVAGSGADIWGTADAFRMVSQPTSGDVEIVARVASL